MLDLGFRALASKQRRRLLLALLDESPQSDTDLRLPDDVQVDAGKRDVLELEYYHVHLPLLEQMGFIEWDQEDQRIERGPNYDEIAPLLELLVDHEDELPDEWL